jgi:hypothetical protein
MLPKSRKQSQTKEHKSEWHQTLNSNPKPRKEPRLQNSKQIFHPRILSQILMISISKGGIGTFSYSLTFLSHPCLGKQLENMIFPSEGIIQEGQHKIQKRGIQKEN